MNQNAERATSSDAIELLPVDGNGSSGYLGIPGQTSSPFAPPHGSEVRRSRRRMLLKNLLAAALFVFIVAVVIAAVYATYYQADEASPQTGDQADGFQGVSRIAFGSCSAYDVREITIFETGVMPVEPDAWIWVGDMVYMDTPALDCHSDSSAPVCQCESDFMHGPPSQCFAGDLDHARNKVERLVGSPSYQAFLEYMCPEHRLKKGGASAVPNGADPAVCPRAILGVYDDHDSGWNNGNRRLPDKQFFKNLYLDAVGEPQSSPRRSAVSGLQAAVSMNSGTPDQQIDLFLLDERFDRTPISCSTYTGYCSRILNGTEGDGFQSARSNKTLAWCEDFLHGGTSGEGSCCPRDDELLAWCTANSANMLGNATWEEACDATSPKFGKRNLVVRDGKLQEADPYSWLDMKYESQFCEVLGRTQRAWLQEALEASQAPLKLVASGSVLLGRPTAENSENSLPESAKNVCSGDDFDCYPLAQLNLLHTLANTGDGCVVVLTGDYHYGDLRSVDPYANAIYATALETGKLKKPVYQVLASGLSTSTASGASCDTETLWMKDQDGLRMHGQCGFYTGPNFGLVEIDWKTRKASLSIRTEDGAVAPAADPDQQPLRVDIDLDTCRVSATND